MGRTITSASIEGKWPAVVAHRGQVLSQEPSRPPGWSGKGGDILTYLEGACRCWPSVNRETETQPSVEQGQGKGRLLAGSYAMREETGW